MNKPTPSPTGIPVLSPKITPWVAPIFAAALAAQQVEIFPPGSIGEKVVGLLVALGVLYGILSVGARRGGAMLIACLVLAGCATPRVAVAPPSPTPRDCQASWQGAKLYDTASTTSAGAAAAVGSLIAGRELTAEQQWAAGITAGAFTVLAITFGSLKNYSERELERCQADETARRITEALRAAQTPTK